MGICKAARSLICWAPAQAVAVLSLVNRSVGYKDGARTPYDLGSLLEHIRGLAPELENKPEFERLVALSRR
jgi:hypothetical protein